MIRNKQVTGLVEELLGPKHTPLMGEAAALLEALLKERNEAYRMGQRLMWDKALKLTKNPPDRSRDIEHWRKDMKPGDVYDMGAVGTAAWIHRQLRSLIIVGAE